MAVEYITINGEQHPIKLGYEAFVMLQKKYGVQIDDISSLNWENYEPALFCALQMGASMTGIEFKWKMTDMKKALNECLWEFVGVYPKFFPDMDEVMTKNLAAARPKKKPPTGQTRKPKK